MNPHTCARARLLFSDLMQLLRDTRHTLAAHHNPAVVVLEAALPQLEVLNTRLQRECTAARIPPWEAPQLPALNHFMDTLAIDVPGAVFRQALGALLSAVAVWLQHEQLDELAQPLHALAGSLPPAPPTEPLDELEPVNEEGS